jgi:hypothetical protein
MPILYVVAGLLIYDKVLKPMLDKDKDGDSAPNKLENLDYE